MWFRRHFRKSYAQCGEDVIVDFIRQSLGLAQFTYLDVGAHHPRKLSNTAMFYDLGFRGVLVEPDPELCPALRRQRHGDVILNCGIAPGASEPLTFYRMEPPSLSTFSQVEAERFVGQGHRIVAELAITVRTINDVISELLPPAPTFLSVDCEGLDFAILQSLDLQEHRPAVICVETLEYRVDRQGQKDTVIPPFLGGLGYFAYADTFINTIFVAQERWGRK